MPNIIHLSTSYAKEITICGKLQVPFNGAQNKGEVSRKVHFQLWLLLENYTPLLPQYNSFLSSLYYGK